MSKFIVFEGIDGCGKSTQMQLLAQRIAEHFGEGCCVTTCEPTDGPVGRLIRCALRKEISLSQQTMAMLYAADRYEHVSGYLLPTLASGVNVLCDRYYFSNFVYQSDAAGLDELMALNRLSMEALKPDLTIFMDASPEYCINKIAESREAPELYETLDKLTRVREAYLRVFDKLSATHNIMHITPLETKLLTAELIWQRLGEEFFAREDSK